MKNVKVWLCMLLCAVLLMSAVPAAMADGAETAGEIKTVPVYSAYERAEQPGMYLEIALNEDTEARMTTRLGQIAAANQDRFDDEKTAATVIRGWFESTHFNFGTMFQVTEGSSGSVRITPDYLRMYDFIAIADAEGRVMLYPFQQYSADLYLDLCNAAIPVMQGLVEPLLDSSFAAIMETLTDEDMKNKLEVAYDEMRSTFVVTLEDAQSVLTPETMLREDVALASAIDLVSDLTVSNLGALEPVKLAAEKADEAWYKLSLAGDVLSGTKLASPVSISEIRGATTAAPTLWLNENGELIYITAGNTSLSADAATLSRLLAAQGGTASGIRQAVEEEEVSSSTVWYVVAILVVLAIGAAIWFALKGKQSKSARPRFSAGGGEAPAKSRKDEE